MAGRFLVAESLSQTITMTNNEAGTDAAGHFAFAFVPPVDVSLAGLHPHSDNSFTFLQLVEVIPGGTNRIEIVTQGRTLTGHVQLPPGITNSVDLASLTAELQPDMDVREATHW